MKKARKAREAKEAKEANPAYAPVRPKGYHVISAGCDTMAECSGLGSYSLVSANWTEQSSGAYGTFSPGYATVNASSLEGTVHFLCCTGFAHL